MDKWSGDGTTLINGECLDTLATIPSKTINAVVTDPPYPEIDRKYGRWTESEWFDLMRPIVRETRRILTDDGSAVFILQPNSEHVGTMRGWLYRFQAWCCEEWNIVQDVWWHNPCPAPTVHCQRKYGLMRQSIKSLVWLGSPNCYRNQDAIILPVSKNTLKDKRINDYTLKYSPSGLSQRNARCLRTAIDRGGSTPMNLITIANSQSLKAGCNGHPASTPLKLCNWWVRYLTRPNDTVLDMFSGSGSVGVACKQLGRQYIGIERIEDYHKTAIDRITKV